MLTVGTSKSIRIIFLLITVLFFSIPVQAKYSGGTGEPNDPYQIAEPNDWVELMNTSADWNKNFVMTSDIDLNDISLTPIGTDYPSFNGRFDGNNYVINNVVINRDYWDYVGLFGYVGGDGQIKNLGAENISNNGDRYVGGLVGFNGSGTITSCYTTGTVSGEYNYVGGLVGHNYGKVNNCYSICKVNGGDATGGLIGYNCGEVIQSYSTSTVNYTGPRSGRIGENGPGKVGGLVGDNEWGIVSQCYSTCSVDGYSYVGGLVGRNYGGIVSNCYSTGRVYGSQFVGGLVGENHYGKVTNCSSTTEVRGGNRYNINGLIGLSMDSNDINNCFWDIETSGFYESSDEAAKTTEQMQDINTYLAAGWDFALDGNEENDPNWIIRDYDYPHLAWEYPVWAEIPDVNGMHIYEAYDAINNAGFPVRQILTVTSDTVSTGNVVSQTPDIDYMGIVDFTEMTLLISCPEQFSAGSGAESDPYQISTVYDWLLFMNHPEYWDKHFVLINDVNMINLPILPVGSEDVPFSGYFDGNGYSISNAIINRRENCVGLFGCLEGYICDLKFKNSSIEGYNYVGGLVGSMDPNSNITGCYSEVSVTGNLSIGGLTGLNAGEINQCYSMGHVTGNEASTGGLVGNNQTGTVTECYNTGTVEGNIFVGGLVGWNGNDDYIFDDGISTVSQSYSTGVVIGNVNVGGLVGWNGDDYDVGISTISQSYSTGTVIGNVNVGGLVGWNSCFKTNGYTCPVNQSYSIGTVTGNENVGGLIGLNPSDNYFINSCFWDIETSGQEASAGGTGKTTAEMQTLINYFISEDYRNFIPWDFLGGIEGGYGGGLEDIWWIEEGKDYPHLWWEKYGWANYDPNEQYRTYSGGSGEPNDPYQIAKVSDIILLGESLSDYDKHFILTDDIDLDPSLPGGQIFSQAVIPVFKGAFNGNSHTISNLVIEGDSYLGLFGVLQSGAEVMNLGIVDVNIVGTGEYVGGLSGFNSGTVAQCYSTGVTDGFRYVGGLVGSNSFGTVNRCFTNGTIIGPTYIGGLVGFNLEGSLSNSYSTCEIAGGGGGLVGYTENSYIFHCYSAGLVTIGGGLIGGSYGWSSVSGCFWDIETSQQENSYGSDEIGLYTEQMQDVDSYLDAGWDFTTQEDNDTDPNWIIRDYDYPHLAWEYPIRAEIPDVNGMTVYEAIDTIKDAGFSVRQILIVNDNTLPAGYVVSQIPDINPMGIVGFSDITISVVCPDHFDVGNGTEYDPYQISTLLDWLLLSNHPDYWSKNFVLANDLNIMDLWISPVGSENFPFSGYFDGNGFSICNAVINKRYETYIGLFGLLVNGHIYNLRFENSLIDGGGFVGGLVGAADVNSSITACYTNCTVRGYNDIGGLVGGNTGKVSQCYTESTVTGAYDDIGGLVGINNYGFVNQCYSRSSVLGDSAIGGLIGYNRGEITQCCSTGTVKGEYGRIGGLVGFNYSGSTITNCYSTGIVIGGDFFDFVGGLVGYANSYGDVIYCFWDIETSQQENSYGGYEIGLYTEQMQDINTYLDAGWDFVGKTINGPNDIWKMWDEYDYPRFAWEPGPNTPLVFVDINDPNFCGQMSRYEVTNDQYCDFLNASLASGDITINEFKVEGANGLNIGEDYVGESYYKLDGLGWTGAGAISGSAARIYYNEGAFSVDSGFGNHPVTYVNWYGAMAFANYYGYYLPTEDQWQAVADYDGTYIYGCGATIDPGIANYRDSIHPDGTLSVGIFGQYGYDMSDMAGNVWEWTSSSSDGSRIFRGGSWSSYDSDCDVSIRGDGIPYANYCDIGFRVCR
ncbi:MAG: SUMF1/EgtB/PvdO family nonheme iron enzyme [Sedimentisphaerales bacterium]|nr:SUMF1/EgtB/PvdO family nonheme iron enzyme [Sedimentisphaerales bacterium]